MAPLWTEDDMVALKAAVASGLLTVSYAGPPARTITYQNLDSMRKLLAEMERYVNRPTAVNSRRAGFRKGFGGPSRSGFRRNE